jgi:hypothetical protein
MTQEQYDRWKDFAMRMARTCFPKHPDAKWIEEAVLDFFDGLPEEDIVCFVDWDNSQPYPEGHKFRRAKGTYRCCCRYKDISLMDTPHAPVADCQACGGTGTATHWTRPYCVGSTMQEWEWEYLRRYADMPEKTERRIEIFENAGMQNEADDLRRRWEDHWSGPVRCCVRAGMDCASSPSAGVMGFTAGDIRRMYPEGVPDWVSGGDERWTTQHWDGVISGVGLVPGKSEVNGTFASMPDDAEIWI